MAPTAALPILTTDGQDREKTASAIEGTVISAAAAPGLANLFLAPSASASPGPSDDPWHRITSHQGA